MYRVGEIEGLVYISVVVIDIIHQLLTSLSNIEYYFHWMVALGPTSKIHALWMRWLRNNALYLMVADFICSLWLYVSYIVLSVIARLMLHG